MVDIKPEQYFVLNNGRVIKNLYELANSLMSMDDDTFNHHVTSDRNDFSNWVRDVFHNVGLAQQILESKDKESMSKVINSSFSSPKEEKKIRERKLGPKIVKKKIVVTKNEDMSKEVKQKIDEILMKEKEIQLREQKIQEIEERIEKKLSEQKDTANGSAEEKFFSKEFIQGFVIGLLITLILSLVYIKFFM